ncbi:MAG: PA2779 family protein [Candidatus Brocadiia bacterium]
MRTALLRPRCMGLALGIAFLLGCVPSGAQAAMVGSMESDAEPLDGRQAREAEARRLLAEQKVAQALQEAGLDADEVRSRLDRLDDQQLERLVENLETIQSGSGTVYVLVALAVVLLCVLVYMQIEAA